MRTKEEIEKDIIESRQRQLDLLRELEEAKKTPEFEKGKWYYTKDIKWKCEYLIRATGYIDGNQLWYTELYCLNDSSEIEIKLIHDWVSMSTRNFKPATKEQIQKILIEVAKKKGFKNGVKYISVTSPLRITEFRDFEALKYFQSNSQLTDGYGGSIYLDGKWAEIIETKSLPVLNGKEGKIENNQVIYGCQKYHVSDVLDLSNTIKTFNITGNINLNGYSVTTSQIEKIVEYLNENSL